VSNKKQGYSLADVDGLLHLECHLLAPSATSEAIRSSAGVGVKPDIRRPAAQ
jgi:hypothetical protein